MCMSEKQPDFLRDIPLFRVFISTNVKVIENDATVLKT